MFNFNHLNSPVERRYVYTFLKAQALKANHTLNYLQCAGNIFS